MISSLVGILKRDSLKKRSISYLHPYLEGRRNEIIKGIYPSQHLWGISAIESQKEWNPNIIRTKNLFPPNFFEKILNRLIFRYKSNIRIELASLIASKNTKLIYSACGPLALSRFYPKTKVLSWVFRPPAYLPTSTFDPYHPVNLNANSGFFCLTPNAEKYFSQFAPSKFIPWCVDLDMFDGKPPLHKPHKPFFLATGKTGRDYETLVNAAYQIQAEIRIIGPKNQKPFNIPENVTWLDTSSDPPDQAIDYPTLKEWYAQCSGVCIPLSGDADDTCGYTNMLEAMAMRKPVVMTRSGCLHIDPATRNFGMLVEPQDSKGWSDAMTRILNDSDFASACGENARKIVEDEFSIERFNRDVLSFINEVIEFDGRN